MTAALTWGRLSYRQQRWELILVALGVAGLAGAMLWFAFQLNGLRAASPECLTAGEPSPMTCQAIVEAFGRTAGLADNLLLLSFAAPFGIGILLGAPLIAREIDGGTAQLAWSLGHSRSTWLLRRIAFVTLFAVVALGAIASASEVLAAALAPERNLGADFTWYGRRGWLIVARGVGALLLGMLIGALIGRVLPAILAAGLAVALAFTGLSLATDRWNESDALVRLFFMDERWVEFSLADLEVDYGLVTASGEYVSYEELNERGVSSFWSENGIAYASEADLAADRPLGEEGQRFIPGDRYPQVVARDAALAGGVGLVALGGTLAVVGRRRPV